MEIASRDGQVITKVIQDEAAWDAIRREWEELYFASPAASAPLDFAWLRGWWHVYKPTLRAGQLRIVTVWRASQLIGAVPLYVCGGMGGPLGVRYLRFISTGEAEFEETCPDYLNILCRPGEETECVDFAWKAIDLLTWDQLELLDLPADTPLLRNRGVPHNVQWFSRGKCPVADLAGGFDAYIAGLSPKTRQHARQYIRAADRNNAVFELATEANMDQFFDDLVRLHQDRWTAVGKPGCFAAERFTKFHRYLARDWVPKGRAVLARLAHGKITYAVLYGFITNSKFDFYQSGISRDNTGPFDSPGTSANLLLMRALIDRGITAYDFLRGSSGYKERLATRENTLVAIKVSRPSLRTFGDHSVRHAGRVLRKGLRLLRRHAP